jgi:hypothetical protein
MSHPEAVMPFCVRHFRIKDAAGNILAAIKDNYQSHCRIHLPQPITTNVLVIEMEHPSEHVPAALFAVRCY